MQLVAAAFIVFQGGTYFTYFYKGELPVALEEVMYFIYKLFSTFSKVLLKTFLP